MARKQGVLQFSTHWGDGGVFATLLYKEGQRYVFGPSYIPPAAVRACDDDDGDNLTAFVEGIDEEFIFAEFPYPIPWDDDPRPCCEILCKHGSFHLKDLKSNRRTFLNGEKLNNTRSRKLATTGDIISMGIGIENDLQIDKKTTGRGGREAVPAITKEEIVVEDLPIFRFTVKGTENGTTIKWDLRKSRTKETPSTSIGDPQYSIAASVLNNPSMLEHIFKFLSLRDLKLARLVSKDWNAEIVKPLARKSCAKFVYPNPTGILYKYPQHSMRMFNYINEMHHFHNETLKIIMNEELTCCGDQGFDKLTWDVTRLLSAVKNNLKFLKLRSQWQDIPFQGVIPFRKLRAVSFHKKFCYPNPNQAQFNNNHDAEDQKKMRVRKFVTSVTNATYVSLRVESDFAVNFLSYLSASLRPENRIIHLSNLTELELCAEMSSSTEVLKALAQVSSCKLKVVCLGGDVEVDKEENVAAVEEFLKNQGPTLEEIRVDFCIPWERERENKPTLMLNFPSFPRLKFLYANFRRFFPIMVFPGCVLSNKKLYEMNFPVIEVISISTHDDSSANIYSVFCAPEIDSTCNTMKKFSVNGDYCGELDPKVVAYRKNRVSELFPNLSSEPLLSTRQLKCQCSSWYY